jgi:hypothetical protein
MNRKVLCYAIAVCLLLAGTTVVLVVQMRDARSVERIEVNSGNITQIIASHKDNLSEPSSGIKILEAADVPNHSETTEALQSQRESNGNETEIVDFSGDSQMKAWSQVHESQEQIDHNKAEEPSAKINETDHDETGIYPAVGTEVFRPYIVIEAPLNCRKGERYVASKKKCERVL